MTAGIPVPPRQSDPWAPVRHAAISVESLEQARALFEAGLADPRGGEYREVELAVYRVGTGNRKEPIRTNAWVFPERFAVCWNGLVYPVANVGRAADIEADVGELAHVLDQKRLFQSWFPRFAAGLDGNGHFMAASTDLLLRLGRSDLAAKLTRSGPPVLWSGSPDRAWLGAAFHRVLAARRAGEHEEAVLVAEAAIGWGNRVRGNGRAETAGLGFLDHLPALREDSARRNAHPSGRARSGNIGQLVERLEDVVGDKPIIPGPLFFDGDPNYDAVLSLGEAAVPALIEAFESDKRISLTVDFARPWNLERIPVKVSAIAGRLLSEILGDTNSDRDFTPEEVRNLWTERQIRKKIDDAFRVLRSDDASMTQWLDAAVAINGGRPMAESCDPGASRPPKPGEHLRSLTNPSVLDLLRKRIEYAAAKLPSVACSLAFEAYHWDRPNSLPLL